VLQTRAGITVENGNTDAEGRLILCDALWEAAHPGNGQAPDVIIDAATLTGAVLLAALLAVCSRVHARAAACVRRCALAHPCVAAWPMV
jgi:leucyl aminopeptidase